MDILVFIISFIAFYIISVPIHELGHLVFGLCSGYRFNFFHLFSFVWVKEDGRIVFKKVGQGFGDGSCSMSPPDKEKDFRFIWMIIGGGLFNIITAFILTAIAAAINDLPPFLLAGIIANMIGGLLNLIPINLIKPNDGMNILKASQSPFTRHAYYTLLKVTNDMTRGKRLRDYEETVLAVPESEDLSNYLVANAVNCEASRLIDKGMYDEAIAQFDRLDLNKLPSYYKNAFQLDYLYYYCVIAPDYGKAKQIYERPKMSKFLNIPLPSNTRTLAAYRFFVTGNKDTARDLVQKAKVQIDSYPIKGIRLMEKDYLDQLEKLMQAQPR